MRKKTLVTKFVHMFPDPPFGLYLGPCGPQLWRKMLQVKQKWASTWAQNAPSVVPKNPFNFFIFGGILCALLVGLGCSLGLNLGPKFAKLNQNGLQLGPYMPQA